MEFSHVDATGKAAMVDVSGKPAVRREALAEGLVKMQAETVKKIRENSHKKGDVLAVARVAGIMAAKRVWDTIPLCHQVALDAVSIEFDVKDDFVRIRATTVTRERTGVEMEALTAVSVTALTIYDMCKAVDKHMRICHVHLVAKTKGEAGES